MCAERNSASASNDVIDLVSDEDEDDNEARRTRALRDLCELASLRSLIPPNFLSQTSESDFNFFSKELALSLIKVSRIQPCSSEGQTPTNTNHLNSNLSGILSTAIIKKNPNPPKGNSSNIPSSKPANSGIRRLDFSKINNGLTNGSKTIRSSITIKPVEASTSANTASGVNTSQNISLIEKFNGISSRKVPITLNGTHINANSLGFNSSVNNLSELTTVKALENLTAKDASAPKSLTIRGFTITPSISKNDISTSEVNSQEIRRKPQLLNYTCHVCHEKFRYNVALLDHLSNIHKVSTEPINPISNSSSQKTEKRKNKKIKTAETKRSKPKKVSAALKASSSSENKQNSKAMKTKRKKKNCDDTNAKKALLNIDIPSETANIDIPSETASAVNSIMQSPEAAQGTQISAGCNESVPMFESIKALPPSPLNLEDSIDDVSSADGLVMDLADENLCDTNNDNLEEVFFPDESSLNVDSIQIDDECRKSNEESSSNVDPLQIEEDFGKAYKFLTYFEIEPKSNEVKTHRCSFCNKGFTGIESVLDHSLRCNGRRQIICKFPNCSKSSFGPQVYRDHLITKHNIVTHSCNVCKSYFAQEEDLKLHQLSCINCSNSQYQCPVEGCNSAYFFELHFRSHLHRKHKIIEIHTCKVCKLIFHDGEDLDKHLKTLTHLNANIERMKKVAEVQRKLEKKSSEKK